MVFRLEGAHFRVGVTQHASPADIFGRQVCALAIGMKGSERSLVVDLGTNFKTKDILSSELVNQTFFKPLVRVQSLPQAKDTVNIAVL